MGRRPVFLIAALVQLLATLGAGYAANFYQLLTCLCLLNLGEGLSVTMVGSTDPFCKPRTDW